MWDILTSITSDLNWVLVLVYARVQASMLSLPGIGDQSVPVRVKITVAVALTPLLASPFAPLPIPDTPIAIGAGIVVEMALGLASGALLRLLAGALGMATTAIAISASLSQIVGIQNEDAPHPLGRLINYGSIALLMALGFPVMLVELMFDGLALWPPGGFPDAYVFGPAAVDVISASFVLAMLLAAPFTLGGFLYQMLSGAINRVMPSLPVVFIGAPASILLALCAAVMLAPMLVEIWANAVLGFTLPR